MNIQLQHDWDQMEAVLQTAVSEANNFLQSLPDHPAAVAPIARPPDKLPAMGLGAEGAMDQFRASYRDQLSGSAGPRYFGFVTGGSTPAALLGDWLAATRRTVRATEGPRRPQDLAP